MPSVRSRRAVAACLVHAATLWTTGIGGAASAQTTLPPRFQETVVFSGRTEPTAVRFAPNGQVFVAEKSGLVLAWDGLADPTPDTVVDLRTAVHNFWDRGLLGLAVDPQYPARPYLYVLYTHDALPGGATPQWGQPGQTGDTCPNPPGATSNGCVVQGRLSRIDVNPISMQGTEVILLQSNWCQQFPSHSIGDLTFGADGMLYVSAGDGASFNFVDYGQFGNPVNPCQDPRRGINGQTGLREDEGGALRSQDILRPGDPTSFDGSVLRLEVSGLPVQAAPGNPLAGNGAADDDFIVAHGLRNPFRIAVRPGTNELWIADVGWNDWEEIDRIPSPTDAVIENFGWPCFEGNASGSARQAGYDGANLEICESLYANGTVALGGGVTSELRAPFFSYDHAVKVVPGEICGTGSSSATGVAFYQGGDYPPEYQGALFFADSSRRCVWTMFTGASGLPDPASRTPLVSNLPNQGGRIVDLQIGPGGDLYYVDFDGGRIVRVEYFPENEPPNADVQAEPLTGPAPLTVDFDGSGSSDPEDGSNLVFAWDLDGDGAFDDASGPTAQWTYAEPGVHAATLRVADTLGATDEAAVQIVTGNGPPVPVIQQPADGASWRVGDTIDFSGQATDPQDGVLPESELVWSLVLQHCDDTLSCHAHPIQTFPGVGAGSFVAPDHEYPSYLELTLQATDLGTGDWLDFGFSRRRRLTFDNSAQSQGLAGFPVLVRLDPTRIDYAQVQASGQDLRFADADGAPLPHEIESWSPGGVSNAWVRVPQIDAGSSSDGIWMYYGNPSAPDAQDPAAVWAGYAGVWHLHGDLLDSTANANHGTNFGTLNTPGRIGDAQYWNGSSWIDAGADPSLAITGALTLEAWIRIDDPNLQDAPRVLSKKPFWDATQGYNLEYKPGDNNLTSVGSGSNYARANGIDLDTDWHWVGASISGGSAALYVDGVDRTSDSTLTPLAAGAQSLRFGRESAEWFLGAIDEIRIAPVQRSAAWMAAQYRSMSDAFVSFGPEQQAGRLTASTSVTLLPEAVLLSFETVPPGLTLAVGAEGSPAPFDAIAIVGSLVSLAAPSPQVAGNTVYAFQSWSDGGAAAHEITAPEGPATWTAAFAALPACGDGIDNDEDGLADAGEDPGCALPANVTESPACDDGLDNDGDGEIDMADRGCTAPFDTGERSAACGLGPELAAVVPLLRRLRRRRRVRGHAR
jgi:glucose/arabinose dehydrogenase